MTIDGMVEEWAGELNLYSETPVLVMPRTGSRWEITLLHDDNPHADGLEPATYSDTQALAHIVWMLRRLNPDAAQHLRERHLEAAPYLSHRGLSAWEAGTLDWLTGEEGDGE